MTTHPGLPVAGYRPQHEHNLALVNANKADEERLLRKLDRDAHEAKVSPGSVDPRWLAVARTHLEQAFMAWNRAIFQPTRIGLPEDATPATPPGAAAGDPVPPAA